MNTIVRKLTEHEWSSIEIRSIVSGTAHTSFNEIKDEQE